MYIFDKIQWIDTPEYTATFERGVFVSLETHATDRTNNDLTPIAFSSDSLRFEPISHKHIALYYKEYTHEIAKYMATRPPKNLQAAKKDVELFNKMNQHGWGHVYAIYIKSKVFVGMVALSDLSLSPEIGIWICEAQQRKRLGYKALSAMLAHEKKYCGVSQFTYSVYQNNFASIALLHKFPNAHVRQGTELHWTGQMYTEDIHLLTI